MKTRTEITNYITLIIMKIAFICSILLIGGQLAMIIEFGLHFYFIRNILASIVLAIVAKKGEKQCTTD